MMLIGHIKCISYFYFFTLGKKCTLKILISERREKELCLLTRILFTLVLTRLII